MVTVVLLRQLLSARHRAIASLPIPKLKYINNPRWISSLDCSNRQYANRRSVVDGNSLELCDVTQRRYSLQQPLLSICRSYARLSTKPTHCANKTDTKASSTTATDLFGDAANMGLFAKFKHMYKQYWYVLIPVHVLTSIGWFGGFYYLSKSGVDVPALLQYIHLSETIIEKVQGSDMGHYAIAYLCYKVATPLRYAVTLGGTTVSIKYLVQAGHIKPMPSKQQLIKMYEEKKATRASAKADKEDNQNKKHK